MTNEQRVKAELYCKLRKTLRIDSESSSRKAAAMRSLGVTERAEGTWASSRKAEMEVSHAHVMLKQEIDIVITSMKEGLLSSPSRNNFKAESKAVAEKDLAVEEKSLARHEVSRRQVVWLPAEGTQLEEESRDANARLRVLVKRFPASLQAKVDVQATSNDEDVRAQALRHVEQDGRKYHSSILVALANRASGDPFAKCVACLRT